MCLLCDGLRANGYLGAHALVGWSKFEVIERLKPVPDRLFDNDDPIVVYAPHFDERGARALFGFLRPAAAGTSAAAS